MMKVYSPPQVQHDSLCRESGGKHTHAYHMLQGAITIFFQNRMSEKHEFDSDGSFLEWVVLRLQDFLSDDNLYTQNLSIAERKFAVSCIMIYLQVCRCKESLDKTYCKYDVVNAWNKDMLSKAEQNLSITSRLCQDAANKFEDWSHVFVTLNSVVQDLDIRRLRDSLSSLHVSNRFHAAFCDLMVDLDSFIAENVVARHMPIEEQEIDKATLGILQELIGFLHTHPGVEGTAAKEEQIEIFLEEHGVKILWPQKTDVRSSDHFFVSYDSSLTHAKDVCPCVFSKKYTLRGSRVLPSVE